MSLNCPSSETTCHRFALPLYPSCSLSPLSSAEHRHYQTSRIPNEHCEPDQWFPPHSHLMGVCLMLAPAQPITSAMSPLGGGSGFGPHGIRLPKHFCLQLPTLLLHRNEQTHLLLSGYLGTAFALRNVQFQVNVGGIGHCRTNRKASWER